MKAGQNDYYVLDSRPGGMLIPGGVFIIFANLSKGHVHSMGHAFHSIEYLSKYGSLIGSFIILESCKTLTDLLKSSEIFKKKVLTRSGRI